MCTLGAGVAPKHVYVVSPHCAVRADYKHVCGGNSSANALEALAWRVRAAVAEALHCDAVDTTPEMRMHTTPRQDFVLP